MTTQVQENSPLPAGLTVRDPARPRSRSRSRSRSPSRSRPPSRSPSRRSYSSTRNIISSDPQRTELKRALCIEGFFHANQYEGPYGRHIAVIIHTGNAIFFIGFIMAVLAFAVFETKPGIEPLKVISIIVLSIGIAITVSTSTVYTRAHTNSKLGPNGRLNLKSKDMLMKIALAFTAFIAMTGIVMAPSSFALSPSLPFMNYFKVIGMFYIVGGIVGFIGLSVYSKYWKKSRSRGNTRQRNRDATTQQRQSRQPRVRNDSDVPEIRVEDHSDTGSDIGTGSDITDMFSRRASLVTPSYINTTTLQDPPPYAVQDPHPGWSDTGSSIVTVSAAHSMVTLLAYAYADELESSPPPPYSASDQPPGDTDRPIQDGGTEAISVTPVQELTPQDGDTDNNNPSLTPSSSSSQRPHSEGTDGTRRPSLTNNCPPYSQRPPPRSSRSNGSTTGSQRQRSLSTMLFGIQTEYPNLAVPEL